MYIEKQYDSASVLWDKRVYLEMEDFYKKNNKGHLTDTTLFKKVKSDVYKYYAQLHKFTIDSLLGTTVEIDNGYKMGYVFYQYTHTLKDKTTSNKTMLMFISEDNGKTWVLQDWTVKWIADQVVKKMFE